MEKIKIIFKGILVWFTAFITMFVISAIDGIVENYGMVNALPCISIVIVLLVVCSQVISYNDLKVVSGYDTFNKMLGIEEDEDE